MTGIDPGDQPHRPEPERSPLPANSEWSPAAAQPNDDWLPDSEWSSPAAASPDSEGTPPAEAPPGGEWSAPPETAPATWSGRVSWRQVGAMLCFGAAVLTLAGSFLTLFTSEIGFGARERLTITITSWDLRVESNGVPAPDLTVPANGVPLMVAAVVLLVGATMALLAAAAPTRIGIGRMSAVIAVSGAAFLIGTVFTVGMQELGWRDSYGPGDLPDELNIELSTGAGFWLLVVAVAAAVVATVFALLPLRAKASRVEPDTPVLGIPRLGDEGGAVVIRLPDEPPKETT